MCRPFAVAVAAHPVERQQHAHEAREAVGAGDLDADEPRAGRDALVAGVGIVARDHAGHVRAVAERVEAAQVGVVGVAGEVGAAHQLARGRRGRGRRARRSRSARRPRPRRSGRRRRRRRRGSGPSRRRARAAPSSAPASSRAPTVPRRRQRGRGRARLRRVGMLGIAEQLAGDFGRFAVRDFGRRRVDRKRARAVRRGFAEQPRLRRMRR